MILLMLLILLFSFSIVQKLEFKLIEREPFDRIAIISV